jgi:hypothetical protein
MSHLTTGTVRIQQDIISGSDEVLAIDLVQAGLQE